MLAKITRPEHIINVFKGLKSVYRHIRHLFFHRFHTLFHKAVENTFIFKKGFFIDFITFNGLN